MRTKEKFLKKLLVEGNDDQHVVWALCEKHAIQETFDIIDSEGIDKLLEQIPVRFKQFDIRAIGIIIDADTEIQKRWNPLATILHNQGYTVPNEFPGNGLIIAEAEMPKVGVWIMPNNNLNGMLEDFISFLVPANDNLLPVVHDTLNSIEEQNLHRYNPIHKAKAVIHTWLAWQENPGTPMGLAITKKYLTTDGEASLAFINWLNELFNV